MANEFKLDYTAQEINNKLGEVSRLSEDISHSKTRKDIFDQQCTEYVGGKNIIDHTKFTIGFAISTGTGENFANSGYAASPFISVSPNTSYSRNQACNVVFYDINFKRIGGVPESKGVFTTPEDTEYIRCSVSKWYITRFQIERGTESTGFEEFGLYSKGSIKLDAISGYEIGKNKFNKRTCESGNVSANTGDVYTSSTMVTSDYIAVIPGETYTRSHTGNYAFYDQDYMVIANGSMQANALQISIPDGVRYIRLSFGKEYSESFQFELGERQTSYEDYGCEITDLIYGKLSQQNYIRSITRKPFPATITPTIDSPNGGTTITIEDKDDAGNLYGVRWDNKICKHTNGDDPYKWTTVVDLAPFLEQGETSSLYNMRVTDTGRICVATNKGRVLVSDEAQTTFTTAFKFEYGYTQTNWGSNKYKQYVMFCAYGGKKAEAPPHEIYISKDYGATWEKLFDMPIDEMINAADYHIHDAAYDPFSGMIIFVNGDTVNSQIHYTYDFGETWDVVNHSGKSSIHPTSIVCLPRGIAFGSDDIPEGVYWWERPYGVDKPVIRDEDFVGVYNFNYDYSLQGVIGVKSDYIIANHGVYAAMPFINHMTSTPGNPRLIVTGDGGVSWHEIFKETDATIKGFYGVQIVEENGKIRIYGNYSINGNIKMFVADMPVFYNP